MPNTVPTTVIVGDVVTVTGRLSVKVSPRDGRFVDVSVQDATVTVKKPNGPRPDVHPAPLDDEVPAEPAWDATPAWPSTPIPADVAPDGAPW